MIIVWNVLMEPPAHNVMILCFNWEINAIKNAHLSIFKMSRIVNACLAIQDVTNVRVRIKTNAKIVFLNNLENWKILYVFVWMDIIRMMRRMSAQNVISLV